MSGWLSILQASSFYFSAVILVTCWFKLLEMQFKVGVLKVDQNQTSYIASVLPYLNLRQPLAFSLKAPKDSITDQRVAKGQSFCYYCSTSCLTKYFSFTQSKWI